MNAAEKYAKLSALARDRAGTPEGDAAAKAAARLLERHPGADVSPPAADSSSSSSPGHPFADLVRRSGRGGVRRCNQCGEYFTPMLYSRCPWCAEDTSERDRVSDAASVFESAFRRFFGD